MKKDFEFNRHDIEKVVALVVMVLIKNLENAGLYKDGEFKLMEPMKPMERDVILSSFVSNAKSGYEYYKGKKMNSKFDHFVQHIINSTLVGLVLVDDVLQMKGYTVWDLIQHYKKELDKLVAQL